MPRRGAGGGGMGAKSDLGRSLVLSRERMRPSKRMEKHGKPGKREEHDAAGQTEESGHSGTRPIQSITAETSMDEFLSRVELANLEVASAQSEARHMLLDGTAHATMVGHAPQMKTIDQIPASLLRYICIPRRPVAANGIGWKDGDELQCAEEEAFLQWRRGLASVQQDHQILLTPFERNLDMWRQLWRAVEKCDVLAQIVDARAPLLFRCGDLDKYAAEVDAHKKCVLLVNKADLISRSQREQWARYFSERNIDAVFWSAVEQLAQVAEHDEQVPSASERDVADGSGEHAVQCDDNDADSASSQSDIDGDDDDWVTSESSDEDEDLHEDDATVTANPDNNVSSTCTSVSPVVLNSSQLVDRLLKLVEHGRSLVRAGEKPVIGMFGYPNVGKSSTINKLMGVKKTAVSSTPGKTRHLQTLHLPAGGAVLLDCPGLVPPSVVMSQAHMLLHGILPVDNMRDCLPPICVTIDALPAAALERVYGVRPPEPADNVNSAERTRAFLSRVAFAKGFMTSSGIPDESRAGRMIVKDVISGRLRLCSAPPDVRQEEYDEMGAATGDSATAAKRRSDALVEQMQRRKLVLDARPSGKQFDEDFFQVNAGNAHVKGVRSAAADTKKHFNRKKKEKLRRVYKDTDY